MAKTITVTIGDDQTIEVVNEEGQKIQLKGLVLFGGDAVLGGSVAIAYGCAADAAWGTAVHADNPQLGRFFAHLLARLDKSYATRQNYEVNIDEIEEMWQDDEEVTTH